MGIFDKQGPYQEFKPLFVKEFDADKTIKTLNDKYTEFDTLSQINKTPALTYEQQEADKIQAQHQEGINKATEIGALDPWKGIKMSKSLAHGYVNDADRLKFERSLAMKETSDKTAGDNPNKVGASEEATDYHAFIGGSKKQVFQGYTPFKSLDEIATMKGIADMINADSTENEKLVPTLANGILTLRTEGHKGISPEKVKFVAQAFLNNPDVTGDYRNKSYAELSQQVKQQILAENPNISERELKAKTYQMLMTPVVFPEKVYKYEGKKRTEKTINRTMSPLEKSIEDKKRNALQGMVGAVAFDEWKNTYDFQALPEGKGAGGSDEEVSPIVEATTVDDFTNPNIGKTDDLSKNLNAADSSLATFTENTAISAVNTIKFALDFLTLEPNPNYEDFTTNLERVSKAVTEVKNKASEMYIDYPIDAVNEDGSNINEVYEQAKTAAKLMTSAKTQQASVSAIPVLNNEIKNVVSNLDLTASDILHVKSGKKIRTKFSDFITDEASALVPAKYGTAASQIKYIRDNLVINNIQANGNNVYLRGSIGSKEVLLQPPFLKSNTAFQALINFTKLTSSNSTEAPLPNVTHVLRQQNFTKIVKHANYVKDNEGKETGDINYTYSLSNQDGTKKTQPLNQTDFFNNYMIREILAGTKGKQLSKLYTNVSMKKQDNIAVEEVE
jgi:hypothetical protein